MNLRTDIPDNSTVNGNVKSESNNDAKSQSNGSVKPQSGHISPGPGFRIKRNITRPSQELIEKFLEFSTPDMSDMMNRMYTMHHSIQNQINSEKILGPACTVRVYPGDNLMVHKALDIAQPGDIIVVDCGTLSNGVIGDLVAMKAKHRGIAGFVIDGLIRDVPGIQQDVGIPIYARGKTPQGPLHRGPGEINYPISCGGIVVNPGDIICGDENGVLVIRQEFAEGLLTRLMNQRQKLQTYITNVRKGIFSNDWVDRTLNEENCLFVD